jgi:hypothetical protein
MIRNANATTAMMGSSAAVPLALDAVVRSLEAGSRDVCMRQM